MVVLRVYQHRDCSYFRPKKRRVFPVRNGSHLLPCNFPRWQDPTGAGKSSRPVSSGGFPTQRWSPFNIWSFPKIHFK